MTETGAKPEIASGSGVTDAVVLALEPGVGALVVRTGAEWVGEEIEVFPPDPDAAGTHTVVRERRVGGTIVYAGVFPSLPPGPYRFAARHGRRPDVTVPDGRVAEVDWR